MESQELGEEGEEEEGRACCHCAMRLDADEGVDTDDGLLCHDCYEEGDEV